jgi:hypothetical protein
MWFRKKPVVIEAVQWIGQPSSEWPSWMTFYEFGQEKSQIRHCQDGKLRIPTLEGEMTADRGDWIIRGVKGEVYPCKPEIFALTYEEVS